MWNDNSGGTPGPIGWNAQIGCWTNVQPSDPETGILPYVLAVQVPGSTQWQTVVLGAGTITKGRDINLPNALWGTDVMARGTYTFRFAVVASDGLKILVEQTLVL